MFQSGCLQWLFSISFNPMPFISLKYLTGVPSAILVTDLHKRLLPNCHLCFLSLRGIIYRFLTDLCVPNLIIKAGSLKAWYICLYYCHYIFCILPQQPPRLFEQMCLFAFKEHDQISSYMCHHFPRSCWYIYNILASKNKYNK